MENGIKKEYAVAAIRISSIKQGLQGDSPDAQREQIERFAQQHNIEIRKFFVFIESASRDQQPIQEAINYCKDPNNDVQLFIIKSIDRFTRGGSYLYDHLKMQLTRYGVRLVDIYGIIGKEDVNTLEHLDVKYDWSVYSPTKKAEILEAERAKDEMRDIMTRMIGAEIRYVRMGYRVRQAPFGYKNEKVDTAHGKRVVLKPHPEEAVWIRKMFELRVRGSMSDEEIVSEINNMGFKTRTRMRRDKHDKKQVTGKIGGKELTLKHFWRIISNPVYAGYNFESWTRKQPIRGKFDGLVSLSVFNKANKGKIVISEQDGEVRMYKKKPPEYLTNKGAKNSEFPYKRYVMCPKCRKPLYGSASRGKSGRYFPAYHCTRMDCENFRIPKKDFDETIREFVGSLGITQKYIDELMKAVLTEWNKRQKTVSSDRESLDKKIEALRESAQLIADKIKMLSSETAIKYMEDDLIRIENEIKGLEKAKSKKEKESVDIKAVTSVVRYYLEHLDELLLEGSDPIKKAAYFSLLFRKAPTYEELDFGTPDLAQFIALKDSSGDSYSHMVTPTRFELVIFRMRT